jgi:hypothetical protein
MTQEMPTRTALTEPQTRLLSPPEVPVPEKHSAYDVDLEGYHPDLLDAILDP